MIYKVVASILILLTFLTNVYGSNLKASWYSIESLKKEGTWKTTKGVMANGDHFVDYNYTCASRMHKLGDVLRVTCTKTNRSCIVTVTDRIGYRFRYTRIDLSKQAFKEIANLDEGVIDITIEVIRWTN